MTSPPPPTPTEILETVSEYIRNIPRKLREETKKTYEDLRQDFQKNYMNSGLTRYIDDYLNRSRYILYGSSVAIFLVTLTILSLLLGRYPEWTLLRVTLFSFATTLVGTAIAGFALVYYPYYKSGEARGRLDDGLVYFLSYMAILSASGMSIDRILNRISEVEDNPPLVHLAKKFLMNVKLFGMDVRTALKDIEEMSPSTILAKQIEGMRTAIATSGDLKNLLMYEVDKQLQAKREKLKAKMNTLVYIGELYVAIMVITPTLFILVIAILTVLGGSGGGAIVQLNVIVFIGIPILGAIFTVLLDQTLGREE